MKEIFKKLLHIYGTFEIEHIVKIIIAISLQKVLSYLTTFNIIIATNKFKILKKKFLNKNITSNPTITQ